MTNRDTTCCFTGHRPDELPWLREPGSTAAQAAGIVLDQAILTLADKGYRTFLSGGAMGWDTFAARRVLAAKEKGLPLRLVLVLPCPGQERRWGWRSRAEFEAVCARADEIFTTSDFYFQGCMHVRNRFLVDHSSYCVAYLTKSAGGTYFTVSYALSQNLPVLNLAELVDDSPKSEECAPG